MPLPFLISFGMEKRRLGLNLEVKKFEWSVAAGINPTASLLEKA